MNHKNASNQQQPSIPFPKNIVSNINRCSTTIKAGAIAGLEDMWENKDRVVCCGKSGWVFPTQEKDEEKK